MMDTKIGRTKKFENANAMAFQILSYLRDKDFQIKMETIKRTGEWEITLFANHNGDEPPLLVATSYNLWSAVRSVLFHFLNRD